MPESPPQDGVSMEMGGLSGDGFEGQARFILWLAESLRSGYQIYHVSDGPLQTVPLSSPCKGPMGLSFAAKRA